MTLLIIWASIKITLWMSVVGVVFISYEQWHAAITHFICLGTTWYCYGSALRRLDE